MGEEKRKMLLTRVLVLAVLGMFLGAIPSISITALASSDSQTVMTVEHETTETFEANQLPPQFLGYDPATNRVNIADQNGFEATPMGQQKLTASRETNPIPQSPDRPGPLGSTDPQPTDATFQDPDILVYNDAVNSQLNTSIAAATNGDMYITYDHDPGVFLRDVYVSKSVDGGSTWMQRDVAVDIAEDESCPSMDIEYSPTGSVDVMTIWYNSPELEFAWSTDGDTWNLDDFGGGITWWDLANCPYVDMMDDAIVIVSEWYDTNNNIDTWRVLYAVDGTSFTTYYFNMWAGAWVYQPRISIQSVDAVGGSFDAIVTLTIHDQSDPNPANWFYEAVLSDATLTGDLATDSWGVFYYMSGVPNLDYVAPDVAANDREVIFVMSIYNPAVLPLSTMYTWCLWAPDVDDIGGATWSGCAGTGFLAFDPLDTDDVKYIKFYRDGTPVHAVWMNATDINYYYSPDGGLSFAGDPTTELPYKVNMPGGGTALDAWHSPDIVSVGGKPGVAWHDTRGGDSIYFNTWGNMFLYNIKTYPSGPGLGIGVKEDIDPVFAPTKDYLWTDGSTHTIEAIPQWDDGSTRLTFSYWWYDGSPSISVTRVVGGANVNDTAVYTTDYMLTMIGGMGGTVPVTGWQPANLNLSIECLQPPPPGPDSIYTFLGWTGIGNGSYTGPLNPAWVDMYEPITQICNWELAHRVNIYTSPSGLDFTVNGGNYRGTYTEADNSFWFVDSQVYTIDTPSPQTISPVERLVWQNWSDAGPKAHNVAVTGPLDLTAYFNYEYSVTLITDPPGLRVLVNMVEYPTPHSFWCPSGSQPFIDVNEPQDFGVPGERYMWRNWSDGGAKLHQYTCTGAEVVTANFTKQYEVTITTSPQLFSVIVDTVGGPAPRVFWWDEGSVHTLEALDVVPIDANRRWNFTSWSDLGARVHDVTATQTETITANYVEEVKIQMRANHSNLQILLDGSPVVLPYDYWCELGTMHTVEAASTQTMGPDIRYVFERWSDMGAPAHFITCNAQDILTVFYREEYKVNVYSTLDGPGNNATFDMIIGGVTYPTPLTTYWATSNIQLTLDTNEFQPSNDPAGGTRFKFVNWADWTIKARTVTVSVPGVSYYANFVTQHRLSFVDPHGTPMMNTTGEAEASGWYYNVNELVTISTDDIVGDTADHRWRFDGWSGIGYTGPNNQVQITMDQPITQTAGWQSQYLLTLVTTYGTPVATLYYEPHASVPYAYWYDEGDTANFEVEGLVQVAVDERAEFDSWEGVIPGTSNATSTTMSQAKVVTANWDLYFLVTFVSDHGTTTPDSWVIDGGSLQITVDAMIPGTDTRYVFDSWSSPNGSKGGQNTDTREPTLSPVTGPIVQTANWITEHRVSFTHYVNDVQESAPTGARPYGEGWYEEGTMLVLIEVAGSTTVGDYIYTFQRYTGPGGYEETTNITFLTIDEPKPLNVYWSKAEVKEDNIFAELWWLWVVIIIVIVVIVVVALMMRKKPAAPEEEIPPPEEEEVELVEEEAPPPA
ncbi:MAG: hypothetical protein JSV43_05040 [Methanobacteriota archaeon]|nr:MAG: hypothetical protein JSV43_05040 [Euryarchaeota archaeon]